MDKDMEKNLIARGYIDYLMIGDSEVVVKTKRDKLLVSAMVRQELNNRFHITGYPIHIRVLN